MIVLSFFQVHWGSKIDWMRHSMTTFLVFDIVTTRGTSFITGITAVDKMREMGKNELMFLFLTNDVHKLYQFTFNIEC